MSEICYHKLAYLEEIKKDVLPESYSGYTQTGCDKCDGKEKRCNIYLDGGLFK